MSDIKIFILKPRLRIDEAAMILSVTTRTVQRYLEDERLTAVILPSGRRQVRNDKKFQEHL